MPQRASQPPVPGSTRIRVATCVLGALLAGGLRDARAQERPYFVTYDDRLEKPGDLELSVLSTIGRPRNGDAGYVAPWLELEYGITSWWTTELYLEGVTVHHDASA